MPYAPVNGIELYYELHGSGPTLLFAHGQGGNHLSWWQQISHFAPHYTCITYDARAFGKSHDVESKGRQGFGADAIGLLDHLGVEEVRVVAHSMGGRPATAIATRDPLNRCRALVLAGTTGAVADEAVRNRRETAAEARGGQGLGAFSVMPGYQEREPGKYFLLREVSRLNPPRARDFLGPPNPPPLPPGTAPRIPMYERLRQTGVPVFFLVGEHDMVCPADLIELCHGLVPTSRYHVVRDSGHSAYWEKPDEFNDKVLTFLQDVEGWQPTPNEA